MSGMIVGQGLLLTLIGVVIGVIAALASTQVMASLLYHVRVRDLPTFALAAALFVLVGLAASYIPARKVLSVNPTEALRGN